jgi:peptide/nickel transport system ATP-binding protein
MGKILDIENLSVSFTTDGVERAVVKDVSYSVYRGKTLGIVGESGSGKSVSSMAILQLLPQKNCRITDGHINFYISEKESIDLLSLDRNQMELYRGKHIAMIFQEPMTSLNPVHKCGEQVMEMIRLHEKVLEKEARQRTLQLFNEVQLPRPEKIFASYPHQISGGQKQRVMIAMALACHPEVLIADEPTTALDVTVQKGILELLRKLQQQYEMGIIFITHDLGVVAQIADDIAVMYKGQIVEQGSKDEVLYNPQHPYTKGLLSCKPPMDSRPKHLNVVSDYLAGDVPAPVCETYEERTQRLTEIYYNKQPLLSVKNLSVTFPLEKTWTGRVKKSLNAVDGVSFEVYRGETLGLVGESGCGKTTLGRALLRLIESSSGDVVYNGLELNKLSASEMRKLRSEIQIIFQDPYSSLNPRITAGGAIMEVLKTHHIGKNAAERRAKTLELMRNVGLEEAHFDRYPHEFSGGQRQRICIARTLALNPQLIICDESVSALDVSVQAQVLNLLNDLKRRYNFTYIFISHDLSVVRFLSDRLLIMQKGCIVESGDADEIYENPQQEYTKQLINSIPKMEKPHAL